MRIIRIFSSLLFLGSIVLTVPLAFDVGGRTCGLAFSLSLASFYFSYSILKLLTPNGSRFRWALVNTIGLTQWLILPSLLIWSLNRFAVDADNSSGWVERTIGGTRARDTSLKEWLFGPDGLVETVTIGGWDKILSWSTPVFQLCEGFCSLLVIQAAGQITRWAVNRSSRSDSWMVSYPTNPKENPSDTKPRLPSSLCPLPSFQVRYTSYGESPHSPRSAMWMPS